MTRFALPLLAAAILSGCAAERPYRMSERDSAELQKLLGDKVAGEPRDCIPLETAQGPNVIDSRHIVFREGGTTWLNQPKMACPLIDGVGRVLVFEPLAGRRICENDIAKVLDTATGSVVAACSLGEFVPYRSAER